MKRLHASIIVAYRCNARWNMCDVWYYSSKPADEIGLDVIRKLPEMFFVNITGGEPFIRQDLPEIVGELREKRGLSPFFLSDDKYDKYEFVLQFCPLYGIILLCLRET